MEERVQDSLIRIRKQKIVNFFRGKSWIWIAFIIILILGIYIRTLPMTEHAGGNPGLWDITTNTWTLGPDLDPWLFLRSAKTILSEGSLPKIDMMRNVPLGFDNSIETQVLPHMIVWTYKFLNIFTNINIEFAGAVFPVIMFGLTIISFFFFVREIFVRRTKKSIFRANLIALIASLFMIVMPIFLSRTVAGIPEKESAAFFFMFLSLFLFLKSWKTRAIKKSILLGALAGISTGIMALIWGGFIYVFIPIGLAVLVAFILDKVRKNHFLTYLSWIVFSILIMGLFSGRYDLLELLTSLSTGIAFLTLFVMIVHYVFWNKISKNNLGKKIPKTIISLIIAIVLIILLSSMILGPSFIFGKVKAVHQTIFKPVFGRWNITVAENRQPNFKEWSQSFGPFIKNIPLMFWMFFLGSVVLFKKMLMSLRKKDAWMLTGAYIILLLGIIFSRYSGDSILNGDNFISKAFYYLSVFLFIYTFGYYYNKYNKENNSAFKKIRFEYLLLFSLLILVLFTVRGAIRLVMVLAPIAPIFVGFLIVESIEKLLKTRDELWKVLLGVFVIVLLILSIFTFIEFNKGVRAQAYNLVPSSYNVQWQKAMEWTRDNTQKDAVFSHWWDYGYWVQSIGERATVLDGGNAIAYWNYLMGRLVLTGDNQHDALEFLYNHKATHLLIDSTDIGKYTAFSSIGSNEDYDRYSWIGTFLLNDAQTQETKEQVVKVYTGGVALDEDLVINQDGVEIFLPANKAGIGAILVPIENNEFQQPSVIVVNQGKQHNVKMRYVYFDNRLYDFGNGIEATAFIFPSLSFNGNSVTPKMDGTAMFISPRLMRGMLAQVYLLKDPLNKFPNFKLVHNEPSLIINDLRNQGMQLPDFVYLNGIQGPIKIWEIEYTGNEKEKEEYIDKDYTKYIDWVL